jgi:hypothetical protein
MEPLILEGKADSPQINFDKERNVFVISGNSYADDPVPYYIPVFDWIDKYKNNPNQTTIIQFKLNYINTASSKQIANLLKKLEETSEKSNIVVQWYYQKDDEDMYDEGLAFKSMSKLKFEFIITD